MKRNILAATIVLGLFAAQPACAQQSEEERIDLALAQAKKAMAASTMAGARVALRRASNCLYGRDSGYFATGVGGPCSSRKDLSMSNTNEEKRQLVYNAVVKLFYAGNQTDLQRAKDSAEDAVAYLEQAKELEEALKEETEAEPQ